VSGTGRLPVRKTYKLFVGGAFPRSESGRAYPVRAADGERVLAWAAQGSRKDLRDAVRVARGAQAGWAGRTAYNRAQVLYRVAEVLEGRAAQLTDEVAVTGAADPAGEVAATIDRWVWYAGWADKVQMVAGTRNPVAGPFWNVSAPEATGVVGVVAPGVPSLLGLVTRLAPALAAGNAVVALASERWPLAAVTLAEVLATSDVPGGVVNILTGSTAELLPWLAGHLDVDALDLTGAPLELWADAERQAAAGTTRVIPPAVDATWLDDDAQSPADVLATMEIKTVWHPAGT
jgi:acyl-CoA reductase-like NAD-dependent aldehyde dehydrogenase